MLTATDSALTNPTATQTETVIAAVTLSPTSLAADTIDVGYNQTIAASGGTGTVTLVTNVTHAIAGLTVPANGTGSLAITGTPTATGTETFTVTATDRSAARRVVSYSIVVNPAVTLSPTSCRRTRSTWATTRRSRPAAGQGQ